MKRFIRFMGITTSMVSTEAAASTMTMGIITKISTMTMGIITSMVSTAAAEGTMTMSITTSMVSTAPAEGTIIAKDITMQMRCSTV